MARTSTSTAPSWRTKFDTHPEQSDLLKSLQRQLQKKRDDFAVDATLLTELEDYMQQVPILPKHISALRPEQVRRTQALLSKLDAQQTRVAAVQFSVAKMLQVLARLDLAVRNVLLEVGVLSATSTNPSAARMVALACPLLAQHQASWEAVEKLSALVANRLSDSKDSLKLQIKLDDNARWASKIGPA